MKSEVTRDSIHTFLTNCAGVLLAFIPSFIITKYIDPTEKGFITITQLVGSTLVTILTLSINSAIIYYTARFNLKNVKRALRRITLVLLLVIIVVGLALAYLMKDNYYRHTPFIFVQFAVVYAVVSFLSSVFIAVLRGENRFKSYNMIVLLQRILAIVFSCAVIFLRHPIVIVIGNVITAVIVLVIAIMLIKYKKSPRTDTECFDVEVSSKSLLTYGFKTHISNVLSFTNMQAGSYILNGYQNSAALGIYNFAYTLMEQLWMLPNAVSMVIMSRIAAMHKSEDKVRLTVLSCKIVTVLTILCAGLLCFAAHLLVPVIFPKYAEAVALLNILLIGSVFITYAKVLSNSIAAYGRPELNIIPTIFGVVSNLLLGFLLIPAHGMTGAAFSTSISLSVQGIASIVIFCMHTEVPPARLILISRMELSAFLSVFKRKAEQE